MIKKFFFTKKDNVENDLKRFEREVYFSTKNEKNNPPARKDYSKIQHDERYDGSYGVRREQRADHGDVKHPDKHFFENNHREIHQPKAAPYINPSITGHKPYSPQHSTYNQHGNHHENQSTKHFQNKYHEQPNYKNKPSPANPKHVDNNTYNDLHPSVYDDAHDINNPFKNRMADNNFNQNPWQQNDFYANNFEEDSVKKPSFIYFFIAITAVVTTIVVIWLIYYWAKGSKVQAPIYITAKSFKVRPEKPGGLDIPHQDKLIYGRIDPLSKKPIEKILPDEPSEDIIDLIPDDKLSNDKRKVEVLEGSANNPLYNGSNQSNLKQNNVAKKFAEKPNKDLDTTQLNIQGINEHKPNLKKLNPVEPSVSVSPKATPKPQPAIVRKNTEKAGNSVLSNIVKHKPYASIKDMYSLQLATLPSKELALKEIIRLNNKNDFLSKQKLVIRTFETFDGKTMYRILSGPFSSKEEALKQSKKINISCKIIQIQ